MNKDTRYELSDHDLLISLHTQVAERFKNLDDRFLQIIEKISELSMKLDQKADRTEVYMLEKEITKHNDRINSIDARVDAIEHRHTTQDTKKEAYINVATWGWKTWLKVVAVISFIIGILKV